MSTAAASRQELFLACTTCNASGQIRTGFFWKSLCTICGGTGHFAVCRVCGGDGRVDRCKDCGSSCKELQESVDRFNMNPRRGLDDFQRHGLCGADAESLAKFFKSSQGLDRRVLGDYLGNYDNFNVNVHRAFVDSFDFRGQDLVCALRNYFAHVALPGEAAKIDRMMQHFAEKFFRDSQAGPDIVIQCARCGEAIRCTKISGEESALLEIPAEFEPFGDWLVAAIRNNIEMDRNARLTIISTQGDILFTHSQEKPFASEDVVFVMAFSLVMLSTDLHNPRVKNKMTKVQFVRSNRGINDNGDVPTEHLEMLYDSVAQKPFPSGGVQTRSLGTCNACGNRNGKLCSTCGGKGRELFVCLEPN